MMLSSLRSRALCSLLGLSFALAGCDFTEEEKSCATIAMASLTVTVTDGNGQRVCDAKVVATDGSFSQQLDAIGGSDSCTYGGPYERVGTYSVTATKDGFQPATKDGLEVTKGECNVNGLKVDLALLKP